MTTPCAKSKMQISTTLPEYASLGLPTDDTRFTLTRVDAALAIADTTGELSPLTLERRIERHGDSLLRKALGKRVPETVVDATAGMGRDAREIAAMGAEVIAIERHPGLWALLNELWLDNPVFVHADAREWLAATGTRPDVVLLDPMFPARRKSAAVKNEARVLQALVGDDQDTNDLFRAAERVAGRIVVKRPLKAPPLVDDRKPTHVLRGKSVRFDVYVP